MKTGYDEIVATYDMETMGEIATHGCQSGVCSQHIYYGDTVAFYDNYEDEITDYFRDNYDADFLVTLFKNTDGYLRHYKNDVAWAYIEAISVDVITMDELTNYRVNADGTKTDLSNVSNPVEELGNKIMAMGL